MKPDSRAPGRLRGISDNLAESVFWLTTLRLGCVFTGRKLKKSVPDLNRRVGEGAAMKFRVVRCPPNWLI